MAPWESGEKATTKSYVGVEVQASGGASQKWEDRKVTAEESYTAQEVDLSGSKLQIWVNIKNAGNDIPTEEITEPILDFY